MMQNKKIKIYLCDTVHNYLGMSSYEFPLNIGYIASYAKKFFSNDIEITLFKYPNNFLNQCKKSMPDIVGFANYGWNADLNNKLSKWVKSCSPSTIIVYGGPNINCSLLGYKRFFNSHNSVDFYIPYEGETPFKNLLGKILDNGANFAALRSRPMDGIIFYDKDSDSIIQGKHIPRIRDLESIPSPYLTGLLDEFFDSALIPMIEIDRGCPYTCTYCAQGLASQHQVSFFSLERVKEEIKYIALRVKKAVMLNFTAANFCIAKRDLEIAKYIVKVREETGYPHTFLTNWAKNQPERLIEIAKILPSCNLALSLQSLDGEVLKNVKRVNIKPSVFRDVVHKINAMGEVSRTEIILGLPGETKESHIQTIRQLFDWGVAHIYCYNAILFEGTEMSLDRENGKFRDKTKFRLMSNWVGKYDGIEAIESEEGIRSTSGMSEKEILFFRPVHWLIQFLWNYRIYFDLLKYLQILGVNPLDYIIKLIEKADDPHTPEKVREIFNDFMQDAKNEWFDSPELVREYYSQPERFKLLKEGRYGKMNGRYVYRVLLEAKLDFEKYLYQVAISLCESKALLFKDILNFTSTSIIDLADSWEEICKEKTYIGKYNILDWRDSRYKKDLEEFHCANGIKYHFYLPKEQERSIEILLRQYENESKNVALTKMSEYMDTRDFFYKAEVK